ncbi:hypothetical protein OAV62_01585 [bacterium]|nr:hypothetical protein [bacterium]
MIYTREKLNSMTLTSLKKLGKKLGIKGYYKWNSKLRPIILQLIIDAGKQLPDDDEVKQDKEGKPFPPPRIAADVYTMKITALKKLARTLKVPLYSKYKKSDIDVLRRIVQDYIDTPPPSTPIIQPTQPLIVELPNDITSLKITALKKLARTLKVPNYTRYKKDRIDELRQLVIDYAQKPEEIVTPDEFNPAAEELLIQAEFEPVDEEIIVEFDPVAEESDGMEESIDLKFIEPKQSLHAEEIGVIISAMKNTEPPSSSIDELQDIIQRCLLTV